jgi:hypothetical protein
MASEKSSFQQQSGCECNRLFSPTSQKAGLTVVKQGNVSEMSRVTNVILTAHVGAHGDADREIASVNSYLREAEGGGGGQFMEVTGHAGGPKYMECRVYLSAFNHADTEIILRAVDQAPWLDKEMVQVFVKEQEDETFALRYSGASPQKRAEF